jgi:hypothetical protein
MEGVYWAKGSESQCGTASVSGASDTQPTEVDICKKK